MPKVGKKHYPYTKAGKQAAAAEAKRRGTSVKNMPKKKRGN